MAYDSGRGVTVMFGFADGLAATYEWDGQSWVRVFVGGPSPRVGHALAKQLRRLADLVFKVSGDRVGKSVLNVFLTGLAVAGRSLLDDPAHVLARLVVKALGAFFQELVHPSAVAGQEVAGRHALLAGFLNLGLE